MLRRMHYTIRTLIRPEPYVLAHNLSGADHPFAFLWNKSGLLSIYIPQLFPVHIRGTYTGICFNIGRIVTAAAVFFVGVLVTALNGYSNSLLTFTGIFVIGFITIYLSGKSK